MPLEQNGASQRRKDLNSFIEVKENPISKTGVFPYLGRSIGAPEPDRIYYVYRPEEELNNPETIESFKLIPFVDEHTMLGEGYTAAEQKGVHGVLGENIVYKDGYLKANIKIFSEKVKELLAAGKKELSAGYRCVYERASGAWNGQAYHYIQRNIRGNHLALVGAGRMGPDVAVLDHMTFTFDEDEIKKMYDENDISERLARIEKTLEALVKSDKEVHAEMDEDPEKGSEAKEDQQSLDKEDLIMADEEKKEELKEEKKAEDVSEEEEAKEEKKAEDEDEEKEEKKEEKSGMDEAEILRKAVKMLSIRNDLASKVSAFVGTFDHSEMSVEDVAKYSVKKLGIACDSGEELPALKGYLHGRQAPAKKSAFAMDSSEHKSKLSKFIVSR